MIAQFYTATRTGAERGSTDDESSEEREAREPSGLMASGWLSRSTYGSS